MPSLDRIGNLFVAMVLVLLLILPVGMSQAQGVTTGQAISNINVRTGPGTDYGTVGVLAARSTAAIEGRDRVGRWLLITAADGSLHGWVASRYITWSGDLELGSLPVIDAAAGGSTTTQPANPVVAGGEPNAWTASQMNLRAGPDTAFDSLGQLAPDTALVLEARNAAQVWALVHTPDGGQRGWVALAFLRISNTVDVTALPVSDGTANAAAPAAPAAPPADPAGPPADIELNTAASYSGDTAVMMATLNDLPLIPTISQRTREIYQYGQSLGNDAQRITKVGDSNSERSEWLDGFAYGDYELGPHGYLQPTIDHFAGSLANQSIAVRAGYTAWIVSDIRWNDPACPNMTMIECELAHSKPVAALIFFGPADLRFMTPADFRDSLHRMVAIATQRGVIPVLFTFPVREDARAGEWYESLQFNMEMINVARQHDIPLVNLWKAAYPLPDHGVHEDQIHLSNGDSTMRFTGDEQRWGFPLWNLMALQTLDALRQELPIQ